MAEQRRMVDMKINTDSVQLVVSSGTTELLTASKVQSLYRGTQVLFRCRMYAGGQTTTLFQPPANAVFLFGIDKDFTPNQTDLVVSAADQFNIAGDWAETLVTDGVICWRADLTSSTLKAALGSDASRTMYACLWMSPVGGEYTLLAQWALTVNNVAVDPTTAIVPDGISFATADALQADYTQITTPTNGLYRIKNGATQLWNPTQSKFHTLTISGAAGVETINFGVGEA